jgi:putative hydrolase of the HAD superfamily
MQLARAVTFDFGQTLAALDTEMLAKRLGEKGIRVVAADLERATPPAWRAYNQAILQGLGGHPWHLLMSRILEGGGVTPADRIPDLVEWLWSEQPRQNLWRRPIPGMLELVRQLSAARVPIGVLSNSEGKLAELAGEMGIESFFQVIADSGKLGIAKPDRGIFEWTARHLDTALEDIVHIGDAFAADVQGALAVGMRAVWFTGDRDEVKKLGQRARVAADAAETIAVLREWLAANF